MTRGSSWRAALAICACLAVASACSSARRSEPATALSTPRYLDVTAAAGLTAVQGARNSGARCLLSPPALERRFAHVTVAATANYGKEQCIPERMSGGAAAGDYDGDGWTDLYVTRLDGPGILYHNDHGHFRDVTASAGLDMLQEPSNGAVWVDVDRDGRLDLFVTTLASHRFFLFHNEGNGSFAEQGVARGVALADGSVHVGFSANVGDVNLDGWPDLVTSEWRPSEIGADVATSHNRLLLNRGARDPGVFDDVTRRVGVQPAHPAIPYWGFAADIVDLDGDGIPDLVMANDFGTSRLFWGTKAGSFVDGTRAAGLGTDENGMGLTVGDYDGDGRLDVFISSIFDTSSACRTGACGHGITGNRLFHNDGHRHFSDVTTAAGVRDAGWGWGSAWLDATNSGRLDLVMTSGVDFPWEPSTRKYVPGPTTFFQNAGNGTFTRIGARATGLTTTGPGKGLLVFDYDRDGREDVLIVRDGKSPVLYRNVTPHSGAWLNVHVVGRHSGPQGLGAIVTAVVGRVEQVRVVDSTTHFLGQSPSDPHFGFGARTGEAVEVRVRWPTTGRVSVVRTNALDRTLTVVEP